MGTQIVLDYKNSLQRSRIETEVVMGHRTLLQIVMTWRQKLSWIIGIHYKEV